jgi:hypothetical protein
MTPIREDFVTFQATAPETLTAANQQEFSADTHTQPEPPILTPVIQPVIQPATQPEYALLASESETHPRTCKLGKDLPKA